MVARVTLAEVDALRTSVASAVDVFRAQVLPHLREQDGYEGCYVLTTADGKALVLSLWADEEAAHDGLASGFYAEQLEKFVTFFRAPPGRGTYDVAIAETPSASLTGG